MKRKKLKEQQKTTQIENLEIRPLQSDEIWEIEWKRFNKSDFIPVPQQIVLDNDAIADLYG